MKEALFYLITLLFFSSCDPSQPRSPISNNSGTFIDASVKRNKQLNKFEYEKIKAFVEKSTKDILSSNYGFWYYYNKKQENNKNYPRFGDQIQYKYDVKTLKNELIYSEEELSIQNYFIDQQELFSGLRHGLKLMKEGEVVTFIFPSQIAYGYYGDNNKIGRNQPLICKVTLIKHQIN